MMGSAAKAHPAFVIHHSFLTHLPSSIFHLSSSFIALGALIALLAYAGVCAAQDSPPPPDPRFGIVETFADPAAATEAGTGYTRIILRWDVIQPGGPADWKPANVPDPYVARDLADGRQVVGLLIGTPAWAVDGAAVTGGADARAVPKMDAWAAFTRRMAQQYRGQISRWIIWNEPDVWDADHPGSTWLGSEADYYRLLKTAYLAIKGVDPTAQVAMAGQTYFWDWSHGRRIYLDRLLDIIVADPEAAANGFFFDAIPYHLYFNPTQAPQVLAEAQATLARHGITGKELWLNETNAPPSDDPQELPWSAPRFRISLQEQAAFVIQEFSQALAAGATRVEVYKLRNTPDHPESIEPFGLLRGGGSRRPAFEAFRVATAYLSGFRAVYKQQMGDVEAVTFDRGGQTTTVLWTWARTPARVRVRAVAGEALRVDEQGHTDRLAAVDGFYTVDLPGAACSDPAACSIGGAPRLLVEQAAAGGRIALPPPPTATPTPTASPTASPVPATTTATATARPSPTITLTSTPSAAPTATPEPPSPTVATPAASAIATLSATAVLPTAAAPSAPAAVQGAGAGRLGWLVGIGAMIVLLVAGWTVRGRSQG